MIFHGEHDEPVDPEVLFDIFWDEPRPSKPWKLFCSLLKLWREIRETVLFSTCFSEWQHGGLFLQTAPSAELEAYHVSYKHRFLMNFVTITFAL